MNGERLRLAEQGPQNWLSCYGTYDGQRYSALDAVTGRWRWRCGIALVVFALP